MDSKFSLSVEDPWLFKIQTGIKTIEGRRGHPDKFKHWIGAKVHFFNKDRKIPVRVVAIRHYPNLYDYLNAEGFEKVVPGLTTYQEAIDEYHKYYSDQAIADAGGMLAIVVELI